LRLVHQAQRGKCQTCKANPESLQRAAARDGLSQALGQFIECVVHNFAFV
jgi:hypothetical protein